MHTQCIWKSSGTLPRPLQTSIDMGVTFEEASTVLLDPQGLAQEDSLSEDESRWVVIGMSAKARLLTVVYTLRREDRIRLISARKATRKEAGFYA